MVTHAMASEPSAASRAPQSATLAAAGKGAGLVSTLGASRTAGSWIAADGRPVVAVTDSAAAAEVKKAGARPKVVSHSMEDLKSVTKALKAAPRVAGTAWAMDYVNNEVVVQADRTVSAADWSRMKKLAESMGSSVRMERTEGTFTTRLNAALPMFSTGGRCSAGYNVTNGRNEFILTAGHCGRPAPSGSATTRAPSSWGRRSPRRSPAVTSPSSSTTTARTTPGTTSSRSGAARASRSSAPPMRRSASGSSAVAAPVDSTTVR